ncbi:MAG: trypsin-like peptidase domain-containing protein [Rhodothalassiaceae bacterium]
MRCRLLIGTAAALLLLATASRAGPPATGPVVFCYDPARDIVQETMARECNGRVIDAEEAAAIRARLARERAQRLHALTGDAQPSPKRRLRGKIGTAFAVTAAGHYLTAAHVVAHCTEIMLRTPDGLGGMARVVARDEARDIALLGSDLVAPALVLAPSEPLPDAPVRILGYPFEGVPRVRPRESEGAVVAAATLPERGRYLALRTFVRQGTSGGPVLDEAGRVAGMIVARINTPAVFARTGESVRDLSYAVSVAALEGFLLAHGIRPAAKVMPAPPEESVLRVDCKAGHSP